MLKGNELYPIRHFRVLLPKRAPQVGCRNCGSTERDMMRRACGTCGLTDELQVAGKRQFKRAMYLKKHNGAKKLKRRHGRSAGSGGGRHALYNRTNRTRIVE